MITQQVGEKSLERKRELLALVANKKTGAIIIQYGEWYETDGQMLGAPSVREYTRDYQQLATNHPQLIASLEGMINIDLEKENPQDLVTAE